MSNTQGTPSYLIDRFRARIRELEQEVAALKHALYEAGGKRIPARDPCLFIVPKLTRAEVIAVSLVLEGEEYQEMAVTMQTSYQVVKNRMSRIFEKFGCFSKAELIIRSINSDCLHQAIAREKADKRPYNFHKSKRVSA